MGFNSNHRRPTTTPCNISPHPSPKQVSGTTTPVPIILILGPPGSGKGTLSARLTADFPFLHHLSVGDWLREQTKPPIAGVPAYINDFVAQDAVVPRAIMEAEYGCGAEASGERVPAPLTLYQCAKRNVSTPESMKCSLMNALKGEVESLRAVPWRDGCGRWRVGGREKAVLLDNLLSTRAHADAAAETFGDAFPTMVIAVDCGDQTAEERFLGRARESDDAARFRRRIARYRQGNADVMAFLRARGTEVVEVSTEGEPEAVYGALLRALAASKEWNALTAMTETCELTGAQCCE